MGFIPEWARRAQSAWRYRGQERPPFAVVPGPGQESVWDYPRPPRIASDAREVTVRVGAHEIARSRRSVRLLETASPPTVYVPPDDVRMECFEMEAGTSRCEWKGEAHYWSVIVPGRRVNAAAWSYANPLPEVRTHPGLLRLLPISGRMRVRFNSSRRAAWSVLRRVGHAGCRRTLQG